MWDHSKKTIYIEISSFCNFNCVFCGNHYRPSKGIMTLDMFKLALNRIKEYNISSIRLSPMTGELFINKDWKKMFDIIDDDLSIEQFGFFTNLSVLRENDILTLLRYKKLKDISISLYGHNFESFRLLTGSARYYYDNVIKNLKLMSRLISLFNSRIKVYLKTTEDVDISKLRYLNNLSVEKFIELDNFMGYSERLDYPNLKTTKVKINCQVLEKKNIILWNGDFNLCGCRDIKLLSKLGNIVDKSIREMYNSDLCNNIIESRTLCEKCSGILS